MGQLLCCGWEESQQDEGCDSHDVIHDLDAFEEAGAVGGHMRFLKPKSGVTIIAVRGRQRYQVRQRMHSVVLKTASSNEKAFYEALGSRFAALEPFLPRYFGTTSVQTNGSVQSYLVLEDVGMTNPAVCDVKLGFVQRASHHNDEKWKAMRRKAAATTSAQVGFRHCGLTYCDWKSGAKVKEDKHAGRLVQRSELLRAFGKFFNQHPGQPWPLRGPFKQVVLKAIAGITALEGIVSVLNGVRFWGASLLFMMDSNAIWKRDAERIESSFKMKLIDFGNATFIGDGPDKELLCSLRNLRAMFAAMLQKTDDVQDPAFQVCRTTLDLQDQEQLRSMEARIVAKRLLPMSPYRIDF